MAQYTAEYFINANDGEFMDFDGWYGDQCVDLFNYYNQQVIGAPFIGTPDTGGAVDLWNDFDSGAGPQFYRRIANTPDGVPQFGDVMIWDANVPGVTGPAGHVGIFTYGDVNSFTSFDQNYPTGSPCHHQFHPSYKGVLGWLRPLANDPSPASPPPAPAAPAPQEPAPVESQPAPTPAEPPTTPAPVSTPAPPAPVSQNPRPVDSLSPLPPELSPSESPVNTPHSNPWYTSTWGKAALSLIGIVVGWLAGNIGLFHLNPDLTSLAGLVLARLAADLKRN